MSQDQEQNSETDPGEISKDLIDHLTDAFESCRSKQDTIEVVAGMLNGDQQHDREILRAARIHWLSMDRCSPEAPSAHEDPHLRRADVRP